MNNLTVIQRKDNGEKITRLTQKQAILNYLKAGNPITQKEAINIFDAYRLSDIIYKLKKDGHRFITEDVQFTNKYGGKGSFARYRLANCEVA